MVAVQEFSKSGSPPKNDLTGQRFGRLVVKEWLGRDRRSYNNYYSCECDCGNKRNIRSSNLTNGCTNSCGCLNIEKFIERSTKHGLNKTKVYRSWADMNQRCINPNNQEWKNYGGRDIRVYQPWQDNFLPFYDHVGDPPSPQHSLDRINNDLGYVPGNVRWATKGEQANNRRTTIRVVFEGEEVLLADLARKYNINYLTLKKRLLELGWELERALTTPVRKRKPKIAS